MNITEVRVKLVNSHSERVRAFCSVTLDRDFVIRDLKVIDGTNGVFVAMPSRKLSDHCPKCRSKNHMRARYCNNCGGSLDENRAARDDKGRRKLHADVAHPINAECREQLQAAVVEAFDAEVGQSEEPGYVPQVLDDDDELSGDSYGELVEDLKQTMGSRRDRREPEREEPEAQEPEAEEPRPEESRPEEPRPEESRPEEPAVTKDAPEDDADSDFGALLDFEDEAPDERVRHEDQEAAIAAPPASRPTPVAPDPDPPSDDGFGVGIV